MSDSPPEHFRPPAHRAKPPPSPPFPAALSTSPGPEDGGPAPAVLLPAVVGVSPADLEPAGRDGLEQGAAAAAQPRRRQPRRPAEPNSVARPEIAAPSRTPDLPAGAASDARITSADALPRRTLAARYELERKLRQEGETPPASSHALAQPSGEETSETEGVDNG